MAAGAPTLSVDLDPDVLRQVGDLNRLQAAAAAGIKDLEREAAKLEKKGLTLDSKQVARLRKFEKLQDEASAAQRTQETLEESTAENKRATRDLKSLKGLQKVQIIRDIASGNYSLNDVGAALRDKNLRRFTSALSGRLGLQSDTVGKVAAGAATAISAYNIGAQIYSSWANMSEVVKPGEGFFGSNVAFDKAAHKQFADLQGAVNRGEIRRSEQSLAFAVADQQWWYGDTSITGASRETAGAFSNPFMEAEHPHEGLAAKKYQDQVKRFTANRKLQQDALAKAFTKTSSSVLGPAFTDFQNSINARVRKAIWEESQRTGGNVTEKFRENAARDATADALTELASSGKLRGSFGQDLSGSLQENISDEMKKVHFDNGDETVPDRHTKELDRYQEHLESTKRSIAERDAEARFNRFRVPARFDQ